VGEVSFSFSFPSPNCKVVSYQAARLHGMKRVSEANGQIRCYSQTSGVGETD
jgi:hypothetical protein